VKFRRRRQPRARNTYWLLALSMVPCVLGAGLGVATGIASAMTPGISLIVFMGGAFGFMYAIPENQRNVRACRCCS
jgi:modulator of FtsH protease